MTCTDFEKLIALDVEGDLPKQKAGNLTEHLRDCPHCQESAAKLQASQALLKELRQEAPDAEMLQEVRRGILERLPAEAAPVMFPVWRFAVGAGLLAILILAMIMFRHPSRTHSREAVSKKPIPAILEAVRQTPALPPPVPAQSLKRPRVARTGNSDLSRQQGSKTWLHPEPLTVKLITDNPNVVIYWQVD